jgi:cytochrome c2/glucose/arabinose dehydrogenase
MKYHNFSRMRLACLCSALVFMQAAAQEPQSMNGLPLAFSEDFENGRDRWEVTDETSWTHREVDGNYVFGINRRNSDYQPKVRSPLHVALVNDLKVADFVMTFRVRSTNDTGGHRDCCVFFGHQDAQNFYYVHLGAKPDPVSGQIMIVNDEPRVAISKNNQPTPWTNDWHEVKVIRDSAKGTIEVYFNDMETPQMTAKDETFGTGLIGIGSFDDMNDFDDIRIYGRVGDFTERKKLGQWERWIETEMPFFSCVVDAKGMGDNNLTPRALVFPLGQNVYLAWDVDLLRVAAVWQAEGEPFTNNSMAVNSYPYVLKKVMWGQGKLPKPKGIKWINNGVAPGASRYPAVASDNRGIRDLSYRAWEGPNYLGATTGKEPSAEGKLPFGLMDIDQAGKEDNYVMIFYGQLDTPETGDYTFALTADNWAKLFLDDQLVVANGPDSPATIRLEAGAHRLRVEFTERGGGQSMKATWSGPGFQGHLLAVPAEMRDPRPPQPNEKEVGRGGLDPQLGKLVGVDLSEGVAIDYEIEGLSCRETFNLSQGGLERHVHLPALPETMEFLVSGHGSEPDSFEVRGPGSIYRKGFNLVCRIPASPTPQTTTIIFKPETPIEPQPTPAAAGKRWSEVVRLPLKNQASEGALNVEAIPLPLDNPWDRGVRGAGIDFYPDGRLAMVTFDGDVWFADGLRPDSEEIVWSRFTSGLHEPHGLRVRDGELFVFDRNGLWRLHDRDNNGEADYHELFCSQIVQTAETREYASAIEVESDGSFLVCKPGQNSASNASGTLLRISPDGKTVTEVARGFRQPFLGYDAKTGAIGVSDQQGDWVPSTPVIFAQQGAFYGHPGTEEDKLRPVSPPLTWIPHQTCASSTSIVWMRGAKMGQLNEQPILLSYHPPKLFQIHADVDELISQGGVTELPVSIDAPLLKGAVNPADGLLYLTGFKIWGTSATEVSWFGRIRPDTNTHLAVPTSVRAEKRGLLLSFAAPLHESASSAASYGARRWNYERTKAYGSPNLKLDGTPGTEDLIVASAKLSKDKRSVFLGIPDMREVMQLEVSYDIATADQTPIKNQTFLTAHLLRNFNLIEHGFADNEVDLTSVGPLIAKAPANPTAEKGAILYTQLGCLACHSTDGSMAGKSGPTWMNLFGRERKIIGSGETVVADEDWLRESILTPGAKVAEGAVTGEAGMPIYEGVLNDEQVESLVIYIKSLKK